MTLGGSVWNSVERSNTPTRSRNIVISAEIVMELFRSRLTCSPKILVQNPTVYLNDLLIRIFLNLFGLI